jgi:hypothetical protein
MATEGIRGGSGAVNTVTQDEAYYVALALGKSIRVDMNVGPGKGKGVCATASFKEGEVVFTEAPLVSLQHSNNKAGGCTFRHALCFVAQHGLCRAGECNQLSTLFQVCGNCVDASIRTGWQRR